ncbi:MAG TPA: hypothetical protein PKA28_10940 [Methylomusa anaerophila]|uniref:Uncharacterized protein n=1 Tax=Methylomusa anaerophila TaxID=1930071 RepID=A0A348AJ28_9FIRM|nr:DUF3226 domain-containing protein [Methylomusa anaerophila]BBB91076.1 hypothetical protein MAMMFC1_01744 [Methylomusa anaerophila]HML88951.1 hypothetical protein [Methylomusa anaerophila]
MRQEKILKENAILAEGIDIMWFCIWACRTYQLENIQVFDFGGINQLATYLEIFSLRPDYNKIKSIVVIRDAETDASAAIKSVQKSLSQVSLESPSYPYKFTTRNPKIALAILPGENVDGDERTYKNGTLEDLCMSITKEPEATINCVETFLEEAQKCGCKLTHIHKSKLHAYLSIKKDYVGMKIGEAAKANAWDWEHVNMRKLKDLLTECNNM